MYFKVSRQMCRHTDNLQCCMFMFSIKYFLLKIVSIEIINVFDLKCKLTIDNRSRNVRNLHSAECCRTNFGPAPSHSLVNIFSTGYFSHLSPASELACWQNCDPFGLLSGSSWNRIHERSWRFLITSVMENGKIRRPTWSSCPWCLRSSCRRWPRPGSPPGAGPRCRTCPEHVTFRLVWPPFSPLTSA